MKKQPGWHYFFNRARTAPYLILPGLAALINGYWHKLKFIVLGKKVKVGKWFRVYGRFHIMGCGKVVIGDNCFIQSKLFKPVSFLTILPEAQIIIGDNVGFSGTTIQCSQQISISNWCNIADAYLVDSPAHSLSADRRMVPARDIPSAPVRIERNVWISTRVVVCHGVTIGENSVVGACSLVRSNIPANNFYAGNPAKFIKPLPEPEERRIDDLL